jgi:uncharacterized membrane protein YfcA
MVSVEIVLAIVLGLGIGAVVGTVGGGGAILALPVFVYVLGQGVSSASTASLIVVTLGASVGAGAHAWHGHVCWRIAATFALPAAAGAYLGTIANAWVSPSALILAFVPVMLVAAVLTYARAEQPGDGEAAESAPCPAPDLPRSAGSGLAIGAMTGFFGVGGGFLIVPAMTSLLGLSIRRAIATSLAVIGLTGLAALAIHLARGAEPDWPLTLALGGAVAIGALAGSILGHRLSPTILARAFALLVAVLAFALLVDVLALGGPPTG